MTIIKSILHNLGVLIVGFAFGLIGFGIDKLLGFHEFASPFLFACGVMLMILGFLIRLWATAQFYESGMRVIKLAPQQKLITTGAFAYSRNPLYLGGNFCIFLGATLLFGSVAGLVLVVIELYATNQMIKREEKQLGQIFGDQWKLYQSRVRRWI